MIVCATMPSFLSLINMHYATTLYSEPCSEACLLFVQCSLSHWLIAVHAFSHSIHICCFVPYLTATTLSFCQCALLFPYLPRGLLSSPPLLIPLFPFFNLLFFDPSLPSLSLLLTFSVLLRLHLVVYFQNITK